MESKLSADMEKVKIPGACRFTFTPIVKNN